MAILGYPTSALGVDNNINKAVFGAKGKDILWDKAKPTTTVPASVEGFQKALAELLK